MYETHDLFVTLQIAKMLQELGFDWYCTSQYFEDVKVDGYPVAKLYPCPTAEVANKWIRETQDFQVCVVLNSVQGDILWYSYIIYNNKTGEIVNKDYKNMLCDSYDKTCMNGILDCLILIMHNKFKQKGDQNK